MDMQDSSQQRRRRSGSASVITPHALFARKVQRIPALQLKREWSPWPEFGWIPANLCDLSGFRVIQLLPGAGPASAARVLDRVGEQSHLMRGLSEFTPPAATAEYWPTVRTASATPRALAGAPALASASPAARSPQ